MSDDDDDEASRCTKRKRRRRRNCARFRVQRCTRSGSRKRKRKRLREENCPVDRGSVKLPQNSGNFELRKRPSTRHVQPTNQPANQPPTRPTCLPTLSPTTTRINVSADAGQTLIGFANFAPVVYLPPEMDFSSRSNDPTINIFEKNTRMIKMERLRVRCTTFSILRLHSERLYDFVDRGNETWGNTRNSRLLSSNLVNLPSSVPGKPFANSLH